MKHALTTLSQRAWSIVFAVVCVSILVYLVLPIILIIPLSFSADRFFTFTPGMLALDPRAFSLRWYVELFTNPQWSLALRNSLTIGAAAAVLSTAVGTLGALALWRVRLPFESALLALLLAPMLVPIIVTAAGIYIFFARVNLTQTILGVLLAHAVLSAPYVVVTVRATLSGFDRNLARAAATLGASPTRAFFDVLIPIVWPGIVSSAAFAFIASFEELVVVLFLVTGELRTLPRQMWSSANAQLSPTIFAAAVLMVVGSVLVMCTAALMQRVHARIRRGVFEGAGGVTG